MRSCFAAILSVSLATSAAAQDAALPPADFIPTMFEVLPMEPGRPPIVVGTAEPGAVVELLDGTAILAQAEANERGEWIVVPEGLETGTHQLTVRTTSPDGRYQTVSDHPVVIAVTEAPESGLPRTDPARGLTINDFGVVLTVAAGTGAAAEGLLSGPRTVVVRRGDTLWEIAERIYGNGIHYRQILEANRAAVPNVRALQPGQILIVPPLAGP